MALPLMPKATAVWLVESTTLTFDQIAAFCGLHPLEVAGIADDEVAVGIRGIDPVTRGQLTRADIESSEADPERPLELAAPRVQLPPRRASGPRYTPVSKRQDRPNAIAWLLRFHPELTDAQISRLVGTTKPTIGAIRDRTHWNFSNIRQQDPVSLGLCNQTALDEAVTKGRARQRAKEAREAEAVAKARREKQAAQAAAAESAPETPAPKVTPAGPPPADPPPEPAEGAAPESAPETAAPEGAPASPPPADPPPEPAEGAAPESAPETPAPEGAPAGPPPADPLPEPTEGAAPESAPETAAPEGAPASPPPAGPTEDAAPESAPEAAQDAAPAEEAPPPSREGRETA